MKKYSLGSIAFLTGITLAILAFPPQARAWDQLLRYVFNSHSELTTDAVMSANEILKTQRPIELKYWTDTLHIRVSPRLGLDINPMGRIELNGGFFPEYRLNDGTSYTLNRLEQGNLVADKPRIFATYHPTFLFNDYCYFAINKLGWAKTEEDCKQLPLAGAGMPLHFNREYTESTGVPILHTAVESCQKGVSAIRAATHEAFKYWDMARAEQNKSKAMHEYEQMYFFAGIAVHAIEDSFAPAHMQRLETDRRIIKDLCYYYDPAILPPSEAGACAHGFGDGKEPRDNIRFKGNAKYPGNEGLRILTTQAATAYLTGFGNLALNSTNGVKPDIDAFLDTFLVSGRNEGMGYLDCSTLKN